MLANKKNTPHLHPKLIHYPSIIHLRFNPKRAGLFGPISQGGGGRIPPPSPPKISETDWRNIKCVVLVDSYDPPESIGTKKVQTFLVWHHSHVKNTKITKNRQNHGFSLFFQAKVAFFGNDAYTCSYSKYIK